MADKSAAKRFDAIWEELRQLLDWQHGFGFYFVFADDYKAANLLRQRVESATRFRTRKLQWVRPAEPQVALEEVMSAALDATSDYNELQSPLWIELSASADDPEWQVRRREILSALNRRRGALEQDCRRPLLLQLPLSMAPEIVTWAPDLWSIRQYIAVLPTLSSTPAEPGASVGSFHTGAEFTDDISSKADDTGKDDSGADDNDKDPVSVDMRRAAREVERRGELSAADGDPANALSAFRDSLILYRRLHQRTPNAPHSGLMRSLLRVGDGERDTGNVQLALQLYTEHVALARIGNANPTELKQLHALAVGLDRLGRLQADIRDAMAATNLRAALGIQKQILALEGEQLYTLRNVATACRNLGTTIRRYGEVDEALVLHKESLDLLRRALAIAPKNQSTYRDVAVSLSCLADAEQALGHLEVAIGLRQECLSMFRELAQSDEDGPISDLALALERTGDLHMERDDVDSARLLYAESVQMRRKLREMLGDTPLVIRALAGSLGQCGYTEQAAGNSEAAMLMYRESAALSRQLWHTSGDNPRALRSLAIAKARLASVRMLDGDPSLALIELEECLPLFRQMQDQTGRHPQTLRDLLLTIHRIGLCKLDIGDTDGAAACFSEEVALARQLVAQTKGALQPQRDLSRALAHACTCDMHKGHMEVAREKQAEAVQLRRDVMAYSDAAIDVRKLVMELAKMGDIAVACGDVAGAVTAYEESIDLLADDRTDYLQTFETLLKLGSMLIMAAQQRLKLGDDEQALTHFERAAPLFRRAIDLSGDAREVEFGLAAALIGSGQIQVRRAVSEAAIEAFAEAAQLFRTIAASGDIDALELLLEVLSNLRELNLKLGRTQEAILLEREHREITNRSRSCGEHTAPEDRRSP